VGGRKQIYRGQVDRAYVDCDEQWLVESDDATLPLVAQFDSWCAEDMDLVPGDRVLFSIDENCRVTIERVLH